MKIGILQCDDVLPELINVSGNYPEMFIKLFRKIEIDCEFVVWRCHEGDIPEDINAADKWLITGSKHSVYDGLPWIEKLASFIRKLHANQRKILGVCFGHQLLAHSLGGKVTKHSGGWGIGASTYKVLNQKPWMIPFKNNIKNIVSHQDQVVSLPENAEILASSNFCPIYMVQYENIALGIQGHPEFSKGYAAGLYNKRRGIIPDSDIDNAIKTLDLNVDDMTVAKWLLQF